MESYSYLNKPISREGDLSPKGIKSTVGGRERYSFNEVWEHIYKGLRNDQHNKTK
jgi:hypothetical protein